MGWWRSWGRFPRSVPRAVKGGIKARASGGAFGQSWWARRWIATLEGFGITARLRRGRNYARSGQVMDFQIAPGRVTARVQGSRPKPYAVEIQIPPLGSAEWEKAVAAMRGQAVFAAKLLAGEVPSEIEKAFGAAGVALFPQSLKDLEMTCSCPDWGNPCKHMAAVHYLLGEEFDRDPFMIFRLRGRDREALLGALRGGVQEAPAARRAQRKAKRPRTAAKRAKPLARCVDGFWRGGDLGSVPIKIAPPAVPESVLKRLGTPVFWEGKPEILERFRRIYREVGRRALACAYAGNGETEGGTS